jgi:hypothetical protein
MQSWHNNSNAADGREILALSSSLFAAADLHRYLAPHRGLALVIESDRAYLNRPSRDRSRPCLRRSEKLQAFQTVLVQTGDEGRSLMWLGLRG